MTDFIVLQEHPSLIDYIDGLRAGELSDAKEGAMTRPSSTPAESIKVFQLNDCDWYAGLTLEECIEFYIKDTGFDRDEVRDAREMDDADMERLKFLDGEPGDKKAPTRSFKDQLALMIAEGTKFPAFFASTEY